MLASSRCKVFKGEKLIYFFYGRPSYRPSSLLKEKSTSNPAFMPITFVLNPGTVTKPKRIAPFDTGAFENGMFEDVIHPSMQKEHFFLRQSMDMPGRLVSLFYGSNYKYYKGEPLSLEIPPVQFEAWSYYALITNRKSSTYDDRNSTIEIQTGRSIRLTPENVLLVILPSVFLDVEEIRDTIYGSWNAEVETYEIYHCNPIEFMQLIYSKVREFLQRKGYL